MGPWLATHFVNPAMLGALALVAAPIIIWLLHRFRYKTVEWAAQTFLLRALKRSQRRLRLENLLLLLIRCLVIACFVIALARPRGRPIASADPNDVRRNIVVLFDTSYSTGYQTGSDASETVHEREKRAVKDLARNLKGVDRLSLIAFDEVARVVYPPRTVDDRTRKELHDDLEALPELQRTARGTDYAAALHALPNVLKRFDAPEGQPVVPGTPVSAKHVFLLTDAQRSGLYDAAGKIRDPNVRSVSDTIKSLNASLHVVDCGAEEPRNVSLSVLETRDPIVGTDMPCYVEASVKNWSGMRLKGLTCEFFVDGGETPAKAQTLELDSGETRPLEPLRYVFHDKGPHRVIVRLKSDALVIDNERALVIDVRESVRVLLVDGDRKPERWESETDFLRKALDPFSDASPDVRANERDIFSTEVIESHELTAARLRPTEGREPPSVVVVANVESLGDESQNALEAYARDGGAVIFAMGDLVNRPAYNEKLWRGGRGILPCKLGEIRGQASSERSGARDPNAPEWVMALTDREHPVLRLYADEEMRPALRGPSIYRYVEALELGSGPGAAQAPLTLVPRPRADDANARPTEEDERNAREGAPMLVEKLFGRGHVAVWLSTVDTAWNHAAMYDLFYVIFWRQQALEMARGARPKKNLAIGERYERTITTAEYAPNVDVTLPDGGRESFRPEVIEGREQFRISYPPTPDSKGEAPKPGAPPLQRQPGRYEGIEKPGMYELRLTGGAATGEPQQADFFAVRIDPSEGDVTKLAIEDWKEALPSLEADKRLASSRPEALGEAFLQPGEGTQGNELWGPFIGAVVVLLALESLLAAVFGRRRK